MAWRNKIIFLSVFLPLGLFSFEKKPWMYEPFKIQLTPSYRFEFFSSVDHGFNPIDYHSNNNFVGVNLLVPLMNNIDIEGEVEFDQTTMLHFGFLSGGASVRKQLYNDIAGDIVSFVVGGNIRIVPSERLVDIVTPYHHVFNTELTASVGKEISSKTSWYGRGFGFVALGIADEGSPWIRGRLEGMGKFEKQFIFRGFLDGYFGLGNQQWVNVNAFDSYAKIAHRSLDLGVSYSYLFDVWGEFTIQYAYRIYAYAYPEFTNNVEVSYRLPFSF